MTGFPRCAGVILCFVVAAGCLAAARPAGAVGLVDGLWVMKQVDERFDGNDLREDLHLQLMSTRGGKEEPTRALEVRWMKRKFGGEDRLIVQFVEPSYTAGITLLAFIKPYVDDERWLFFPKGPAIRRIRASDEHSNFMGTDFTYYDLSEREPDEENHKLLRIEKFMDADCYVVESTPKGPVGGGYSRKLLWVDAQRFVKLRIQYYHASGRFWKQYDTFDWRQVDGIWTPAKVRMEDFMQGHATAIDRTNVRYDRNLSADFFEPHFIDCLVFRDGEPALIPFEQRPTAIFEKARKGPAPGTGAPRPGVKN